MLSYTGRPRVPPGPQGEAVLGLDAAHEPVCHRIADGLFLGAEEAALRPVNELRALGIGAVVNCTLEGTNGTPCAHAAEGVAYCRVSCVDNEGADILSFLEVAADWIAVQRAAGTGVLVHCQMGVSRSATVTIAALMLADGCSRDEAYLRVKQARRHIEPNRSFWKQLAQFEEELVQRRRNGVRSDEEPVLDETWIRRSVARFGIIPNDIAAGLPASAEGLCTALRRGVDLWLGRGCDPATNRWLEDVALRSVAAGEGCDTRVGALTALRETLLSPEYMVDWACELRQRELAAIVALLRAVYAVDASIIDSEAAVKEAAELAEGIRVVSAIRLAVCERQ